MLQHQETSPETQHQTQLSNSKAEVTPPTQQPQQGIDPMAALIHQRMQEMNKQVKHIQDLFFNDNI